MPHFACGYSYVFGIAVNLSNICTLVEKLAGVPDRSFPASDDHVAGRSHLCVVDAPCHQEQLDTSSEQHKDGDYSEALIVFRQCPHGQLMRQN